jgi:pimeloyl-ACP methyl ester carboxylesterase
MTLASVNGININYEQTGSGPHLALIHGLTGSLKMWQSFIVPALNDRFTVLTFDLRGHGRSDMPPTGYTSADMACDLIALLDSLGVDRAHVVGHSIGGIVALHAAALYPNRFSGVSLCDSRVWAIQPVQKVRDWPHWKTWKAQLEQQGLTVDGDSELDFSLLASLSMQQVSTAGHGTPKRTGGRMDRWDKLLSSTNAAAELKDPAGLTVELINRLRPPIQGIYGELSFCLPTLERLANLLPDLKPTVLAGVGHLFPITRPALFAEHVRAFHTGLEEDVSGDIVLTDPPFGETANVDPPTLSEERSGR